MNHFINKPEDYVRDINFLKGYIEQETLYLSRMTGRSEDECRNFITGIVNSENSRYKLKDPAVRFLNRDRKTGDRNPATATFNKYLSVVEKNELIIAPTMTTYLPPKVKKSLIAEYIRGNLKKRKDMKGLMFKMKMLGEKVKQVFYNLLQSTFKIKNNSISGAHASPYQILYNKSSHSTLTSTCRTATSYANANNEKFLMGNRHYWSPEITRANILSIVSLTDKQKFKKAMDKFKLHEPSVEETMACIRYSSDLYWINDKEIESLTKLVSNLSGFERAMFVYVGDLYHLAKYNDHVVRTLLGKFAKMVNEPIPNAETYIKKLNSDALSLVSLLCSRVMKGNQLNDLKEKDKNAYGMVGATAKNILDTLDEYSDLIHGLWVTKNLPASVYKVPLLYRKCAIVSDTDSTIFTNQYWTKWFVGQVDWSDQSYAVGYTTTFLTSQIVVHQLACMSANMGVARDQIHQLTMKSEFYFPTLTLTSGAKHYYSFISAQEGNVFDEMEMEIKGVALKSSTWSKEIAEALKTYMKYLMTMTMEKGVLTYDEIMKPVYDIEMNIINNINSGGYTYFNTGQIKGPESYKAGEDAAPFQYYKLWQDVFAPKYGSIDPPPYQSYKVSLTVDKPAKFKEWLDTMEDQQLANRFRLWMSANNKNNLPVIRLPEAILQVKGIPKEIIDVIDKRTILYNTVSGFYMVLESMGLFIMEKDRLNFISDFYKPKK